MPAPRQALDASLTLVRDRKVGGNAHPSMLRHHFVSLSLLVREPADALAQRILDDQQDDPEGAHWGENGNAIADVNLQRVKCREAELRISIPGTSWTLTGHPDGIDYRTESGEAWPWPDLLGANKDARVFYGSVFENKAPLHDPGTDPYSVEMAYRQGLGYLAMANAGPAVIAQAIWLRNAADEPLPNWHLPALRRAGQVVVCLTPYDSPKREVAFPVDDSLAAAHLARLLEKAAVVVKAVEVRDATFARREWVEAKGKGVEEFDVKGKVAEVTDADLEAKLRRRADLQAQAKALEEEVDGLNVGIARFLAEKGSDRLKVAGQTLGLVRAEGGWRHYYQAPATRFQTWGKLAPAPVQVQAVTP